MASVGFEASLGLTCASEVGESKGDPVHMTLPVGGLMQGVEKTASGTTGRIKQQERKWEVQTCVEVPMHEAGRALQQ